MCSGAILNLPDVREDNIIKVPLLEVGVDLSLLCLFYLHMDNTHTCRQTHTQKKAFQMWEMMHITVSV